MIFFFYLLFLTIRLNSHLSTKIPIDSIEDMEYLSKEAQNVNIDECLKWIEEVFYAERKTN